MFSRSGVVNAGLFQANWFACVAWGATGAPAFALVTLSSLLLFSARGGALRVDLVLALLLAVVGLALDSLWIRLGILDFHGVGLAPVWIVMMWMGVALTVNHSLSLFLERPWLGALLAAGSAPLCYLGGQRLGGVIVASELGLALVALAWLLIFAVVFTQTGRLKRWLDRSWFGTVTAQPGETKEI